MGMVRNPPFGFKQVKLVSVIALVSALCILLVGNTASAQYFSGNDDAPPTQGQLEECEQLGIEPETCTENTILAKRRLMAATPVEATNSGEVIMLTAVSEGDQDGTHYEAKITWITAQLGEPHRFHIEVFPANQLEPKQPTDACYDFRIYKGDKFLLPTDSHLNCRARTNEDFSQDYEFVFLDEGSYVMSLDQINHEGGSIQIPIQVTPEFPVTAGLAVAVLGSVFAAIIITRTRLFALGY